MLGDSIAMACYSTDSLEKARHFYGDTLGIAISHMDSGSLVLDLANDSHVLIYEKEDHAPSNYTTLVLTVDDVRATVAGLKACGVEIANLPYTDEDGVAVDESMPPSAWFTDPAGNWIAISEMPEQ